MFNDIAVCFGKEFKFYFQSKMVYLLLLVYGVMSTGFVVYGSDFYNETTVNLYQFFKFQPGILALIVPALTMRLWADEYKHNTLEVLLTQPVADISVVLGKFLAVWSVVGVLIASGCGFWVMFSFLTSTDNKWVLANFGATFLMAGSLCAMASAAAALCYNALGAFLAGVSVCMLTAVLGASNWVSRFLPDDHMMLKFLGAFDFSKLFDGMIMGQADVASAAYFVLLIAAALGITVAAVEYKRG